MDQTLIDTKAIRLLQMQLETIRLRGVSTIDFHITARCRQACPYSWGPRRFRNPVDTETAQHIITRIKDLGVRRIVFKVCTLVTLHNLENVLTIARLVEGYSLLDKLYVMVFPDGSLTIPKGTDYLNFGPFLSVKDFEQTLHISQFDSDKHLRRSRGWDKGSCQLERLWM